jgi:N-acetylglucosamine malate deacetylase 1
MNIKNDIKNVFSSTKSLLQVNRYRTFVSLAGSDLQRKVVSSVPKSRVLVLSAHPEDATVGCVGALIKHIGQEDEVKILHLSDGSLSFPTNIRPTASEKKKMGQTRETEATEAANIIGVKDLQFWRFAQGSIQTNKTTIKLMQGILDTYKPQLIYCPFPLDDDHDRLEAAKILYEGLRLSDSRAKIYCYEVWNTIVANTILDISQQMEL